MNASTKVVSIHPYFKVHADRMDDAKATMRAFVEKTATEEKCLNYDFTINGDVVFCRESYEGAEGALAHLGNVGDLLQEMLSMSDLIRLEIHGSAWELEKLRGPLADHNPAWFVHECGLEG
jgi:quinol monooxygenase YgiN